MNKKYYKKSEIYISPNPSELPKPQFNNKPDEKKLILILSDDELSLKQLELLRKENVLDKFEIFLFNLKSYEPFWINRVIGFPSVYDKVKDCMHLGYTNYSNIIDSLDQHYSKKFLK